MKSVLTQAHPTLRIAVDIAATREATRFLSELVQVTLVSACGFDASDPATVQFRLATVEAITNVHRHAYGEGKTGPISLEVRREGDSLLAILRDRGAPFNPMGNGPGKIPDPEELAEGGYGLGILSQVLDEVRYRRDGAENELSLVKRMWP